MAKMLEFCAICIEEVIETYKLTNCTHKFCKQCLQQQLINEWPNLLKCALCREYWNLDEMKLIYQQLPNWKIQDIIGHRMRELELEYQVVRSDNQISWEPASLISFVHRSIVIHYEARLRAYMKYYLDRQGRQY